jgi:hypothetical protein
MEAHGIPETHTFFFKDHLPRWNKIENYQVDKPAAGVAFC